MLPPPLRLQTIEYMSIVSLCVCAPSAHFISNYSISKSIRRVAPAALVVTGRSITDISQILKYIGYYIVTSAQDTHILAKKSDEIKVVSVASNKNSILTADMQVNGLKFKLVASSAIHSKLLVSTLKNGAEPQAIVGLFTTNPYSKSSQTLLASLGTTLATRDDHEDDTPSHLPRLAKSSSVPAIAIKGMVAHGTGIYILGQSTPGPYHMWSRIGT